LERAGRGYPRGCYGNGRAEFVQTHSLLGGQHPGKVRQRSTPPAGFATTKGRPTFPPAGVPRGGSSGGSMEVAGLAHHLLDLGDVLLFQLDLLAGVLLQPHALVAHEIEQLVVRAQRLALVLEGLM
jgi:hypothetical protein